MGPETIIGAVPANSDMLCPIVPAQANALQGPLQRESAVSADDRLDWDAHIPTAPRRRSGLIEVQLDYRGRGRPAPIDNPWA
jgi:hypothetical protein